MAIGFDKAAIGFDEAAICLDKIATGAAWTKWPSGCPCLLNTIAIGAGLDKIAIGLLLTKWPNWAGLDKTGQCGHCAALGHRG